MDELRNKFKKDWFHSYNMIFEQKISIYAKMIYLFLCRCADGNEQSFPSRQTISLKCGMSVRSVDGALNELENIKLIKKEKRLSKSGGQTSNLYTIFDEPFTNNVDVEALSITPPVQEVHPPRAGGAPEVILNEVQPIEVQSSQVSQVSKTSLDEKNGQDKTDKTRQTIEWYTALIKKNINFNDFALVHPNDLKIIEEFIGVILDVLLSRSSTIRIDKEDKEIELVKSVLLKLDYATVEHVLYQFQKITTHISKKKQYILTMLYNSKMEFSSHYTNAVKSDFAAGLI